MGIGGDRVHVGHRVVAKHIGGCRDQRAHADGLERHVVSRAIATRHVTHLVDVAALDGIEGDIAHHQGAAGTHRSSGRAGGGLDGIPLVQDAAGAGIDEIVHLGRRLVGLDAIEEDFIGQHRTGIQRIDHRAGRGHAIEADSEMGAGLDDGLVRADAATGVRAFAAEQGLADAGEAAIARMHDEVAADDRHAAEGTVVTHVLGAVTIDDHVTHAEGICRSPMEGTAVRCEQGIAASDDIRTGGGGGLGRDHGKRGGNGKAQQADLMLHDAILPDDQPDPLGRAGCLLV